MAYILPKEKQVTVISALAEGSSIRSIERITGIHRDTIMRLGTKVGQGCARVLDEKMRDLSCNQLQLDEIWGLREEKRHMKETDDPSRLGDAWTFCAIDADTKIVPCFRVGKRDSITANAFACDLAGRLKNRVQISTDKLRAYVDAIELAFGSTVDYGQIVKSFEFDNGKTPERRYSPPEVISVKKSVLMGEPIWNQISTSYVERLNASTRLHMRRLTRLTLAFSKKWENFEAAVALHFAAYNFVRRHATLRMSPAMAAGVENDFWSYGDLVEAANS